MKFTKSQQKIYNLLRKRGPMTTREIDTELFMTRSSMRISEINHTHKQETGEPLIITVRKKPNGEHVKGINKPLTRRVSTVKIVEGRAIETFTEVEV